MDNPSSAQLSLGLEGELRVEEQPIRLAMVGCGSHTYRNILPVLRFLPAARLEACCDLNLDKARAYATAFGARSAFSRYQDMLDEIELDGILVVVGFAEDGQPRYPEIVSKLLARRLPVWMEKPPAANEQGVIAMQEAIVAPAFAQVGFKKMFAPATAQVRKLLSGPEFDHIASYTYRYSADLPNQPSDLTTPDARRFLDDFVHVASVIVDLIGIPAKITSYRDPCGDGILVLEHASGTVGTVHLSANASGLDAIEDVMIVGRGANVRVHNGVEVEYFPTGWRGPYGRSTSYFPQELDGYRPEITEGPRRWFPEFSLGTITNGRHFIQGYYQELASFVSCIRSRLYPERADLYDARRVMAVVDAIGLPYGVPHSVSSAVPPLSPEDRTRPMQTADAVPPFCGDSRRSFTLKDGWNYSCDSCGATATVHEQPERSCPLIATCAVVSGANAS